MPTRRRKITRTAKSRKTSSLVKVATGIDGFDEITGGGLPQGRPTLVCGGPGCGKTLFALEFLVHGAARGEPGVFVTFEEAEEDVVRFQQHLPKPIDPGRLVQAIHDLTHRST